MLKRPFRLKSARLFAKALSGKRFYIDSGFVVYVVPRLPDHPASTTRSPSIRFGFIVSKKTEKSAVRRNRIKRRFREAIRTLILPKLLEQITTSSYHAVVVIVRPRALEWSHARLTQQLQKAFLSESSIATESI